MILIFHLIPGPYQDKGSFVLEAIQNHSGLSPFFLFAGHGSRMTSVTKRQLIFISFPNRFFPLFKDIISVFFVCYSLNILLCTDL